MKLLIILLLGVVTFNVASGKYFDDRENEIERELMERYMDEKDNEEEDLNDYNMESRDPRPWKWLRKISVGCTVKCTKYNWCRVKSLSFGRCYKPRGCNCSKFAWEGRK